MKKTIKHKALIINILLVVAMAMMVTGAWYVINSGRKVESDDAIFPLSFKSGR